MTINTKFNTNPSGLESIIVQDQIKEIMDGVANCKKWLEDQTLSEREISSVEAS